eukprot:Opistho-2@82842
MTNPAPRQVTSPAPRQATTPAPRQVTAPAPRKATYPASRQVTAPAPRQVTTPAPRHVTAPTRQVTAEMTSQKVTTTQQFMAASTPAAPLTTTVGQHFTRASLRARRDDATPAPLVMSAHSSAEPLHPSFETRESSGMCVGGSGCVVECQRRALEAECAELRKQLASAVSDLNVAREERDLARRHLCLVHDVAVTGYDAVMGGLRNCP